MPWGVSMSQHQSSSFCITCISTFIHMSIQDTDPALKLCLLSRMFVVQMATPATFMSVSPPPPMVLVMVIFQLFGAVCCTAALRQQQFLLFLSSSSFRHFEHNLHVWSIRAMRIWTKIIVIESDLHLQLDLKSSQFVSTMIPHIWEVIGQYNRSSLILKKRCIILQSNQGANQATL